MKIFSGLCTRFGAFIAMAASAAALSISFGLAAAPAGASGSTIDWTGNGTNAGLCASSENIGGVTVPDGEQAWLFILTSPGTGPFSLTTLFSPAGDTSANGTQEGHGNGAVHFVVFSPLGAKLISASAGPGTEHSMLTVSGCQDGTPVTTTTTTDTPDTTTTTTDTPDTTTTTTDTPDTTTTTTDTPNTTTTDPSNSTTTTTTTGGSPTAGNTTGGNTTSGPSAPSNVVFTPDGGTIVATSAPSIPMNHSGLAFTGANTAAMVAAGLALIGTGSVLILLTRNRRRAAAAELN